MTAKAHDKFRQTKRWKDFRKEQLSKRKLCEVCGLPVNKRANLHHRYPEEYENLKPGFFVVCHSYCHDYFHYLAQWKDRSRIDERLLSLLDYFLPR